MYALPIGAKITSPTTTYTITGVLGSGGFGITYSATCIVSIGPVKAKANVALKEHFIKADCQRNETTWAVDYSEPVRQRVELTRKDFIAEARRLNNLSGWHTNIVTVSEVFEANNTAYYAMELLEGQSLRDYVADRGTLSESEMLSIMTPIVGAVAFLHTNRITHLDIKPQNIMITTDEDGRLRPVLIDFGLSKHYDENGDATSTINSQGYSDGYAPNEQYYGIKTFSPVSDVYSLAATMFYCLTGHKLPEAYKVTPALVAAELPDSLSPILRDALIKALSISPENRQKDAAALLVSLGYEVTDSTQEILEAIINYEDELYPIIQENKIGFADKTGKIIIPCEYDYAYSFSDGLASVKKDRKYGFIDKTGKVVIPLKYDNAWPLCDGLAPVEKDGKWGFIDKSGKIVIPLKYHYIRSFSKRLCLVNKDGKEGIIDKTGKEVIPLVYDTVLSFSDGLSMVKKNGKWGFVDKTGKEVIPLIYDDAHSFSEGLAPVKKDDKWGFIDKSGKEAIPMKYDDVWWFSDGLAEVKKDGKWGFIDKTGKEVISAVYDKAWSFRNGLSLVKKDEKYSYIDNSGKVVIPLEYDDARPFSDGLAEVKKDGKWGFIDKDYKEVIPLVYDKAWSFSDGLAKVKKDGKWGFIDKSGQEVITPKYDGAGTFKDDLALVIKDGKYGYIDKSGKEVITPKYDHCFFFHDGLAIVVIGDILNGKRGIIDRFGNFKPDDD